MDWASSSREEAFSYWFLETIIRACSIELHFILGILGGSFESQTGFRVVITRN